MFCTTSALGISWQHPNHPNLLLRSVNIVSCSTNTASYISISLSHKDNFSKVKNSYIKSSHYSICNDYDVMQIKHGCIGIAFIS